jgi:hypothetical protein
MDTRGINGRLERLERFNREALDPPDIDVKAELIKKINRIAERAGISPLQSDVDAATVQERLQAFREYIKRNQGG